MTHKMIEVTTHDATPIEGGLLHHSTCWCKQPDPDAVTYECECCEQMTCTKKLKGIGYVCDGCVGHWDDAFGSCRTVTITIRREDATWLYECVDDTVDRFFDRRLDFDRPHQRCMVAIQQALDADR